MTNRVFGKTGLSVSPLGFGGASIGFLKIKQQRVNELLNLLLDHGVNLIDTAASYGRSEELIGEAVIHRREQFVLVSKCGHEVRGVSGRAWSAKLIRQTVDRALRRLKTDHLDVMLLHSCDLEVLKKGEVLGALVKARQAGKIRFLGYSGDNEEAVYALALPDVDVIETSVNICDQLNIYTVLPLAEKHRVGILAKRPIINAAWNPLNPFRSKFPEYIRPYEERLKGMVITPADLGFAGPPEQVWPNLALRFTLSQPGIHNAIIGTTKPENAKSNILASQQGPLPESALLKIRETFLVAEKRSGQKWHGLT